MTMTDKEHELEVILTKDDKEHKLEVMLTKDTPYLIFTGEVWDVCCEDFGQNWPRYKGTALC